MESSRSWAPKTELVVIGWTLTVGAVLWLLLAGDPRARLLAGIATVLLIVACGHASLVRPRLRVDQPGIVIRELGGSRELAWNQFRHRIRRGRRLGMEVVVLEIDVYAPEEHLVVLTQLDLGADPVDVDRELTEQRVAALG